MLYFRFLVCSFLLINLYKECHLNKVEIHFENLNLFFLANRAVKYFDIYNWFYLMWYNLVGKTSLITRFMYDSFDNTYQVSVYSWIRKFSFIKFFLGNNRYWFSFKDYVLRRSNRSTTIMVHKTKNDHFFFFLKTNF